MVLTSSFAPRSFRLKRCIGLCLVFCLSLSLAACSGNDEESQEVSRPSYPPLQALGQITVTSGQFLDFAATNDRLYVAAGFDGLRIVDTRDLMSPRQVGAVPQPTSGGNDQVVAVAVTASTLVVSVYPGCSGFCQLSRGELRFYDLASPNEPRYLATLSTAAYAFAVGGSTVFAIGPPSGFSSGSSVSILRAIDVSTPSSPRLLSTIDVANAKRLVKQGNRLILGFSERLGGSPGLQVVDVANPSNPVIVDVLGTPSLDFGTNDVVADSDAIFSASGTAEIRSYSTTGPLVSPITTPLTYNASGVALSGSLLLVSQADSGVAVFRRGAGGSVSLQTSFPVDGVSLAVATLPGYGVARVAEVRASGTLIRPERLVFFALPR